MEGAEAGKWGCGHDGTAWCGGSFPQRVSYFREIPSWLSLAHPLSTWGGNVLSVLEGTLAQEGDVGETAVPAGLPLQGEYYAVQCLIARSGGSGTPQPTPSWQELSVAFTALSSPCPPGIGFPEKAAWGCGKKAEQKSAI